MANNTTSPTSIPDDQHKVGPVETGILMLSCVIALFSNLFVLYLILTVPRLKTVTNVFVFSICVCNIMFASILLPAHCFFQMTKVYNYIVIITILIYICNLSAVSYDRLVSITNPMLYALKITKPKAIKIVIVMWVAPTCYGMLPVIWFNRKWVIAPTVHYVYTMGTLVVFLLGPLGFIIFVYVKVVVEMKRMNDFKKRSLTPTTLTLPKNDKCSRKTSRFEELRKLPMSIIHNLRRDNNNHTKRISDLTKIPTKLFCKMRSGSRTMSLHSTSSNQSETRISSPQSDMRNSETCPNIVAEHLELTKTFDNETYQAVPFISMDNGQIETTSLVKETSEDRNDGFIKQPPKVSIVINHHESDSDSNSTTSRFSCTPESDAYFSPNHMRKRQSSISRMKQKAYELKASLAFLIVALTYMFTWIPVIVLTLAYLLGHTVASEVNTMSLYAIALNSLSDPFLYGLLLPNFRKTLKIMLQRIISRTN